MRIVDKNLIGKKVEQVNLFSERKKLADQYEQWKKENPRILDCPFSVISFLESIGRLKDKQDMEADKCSECIPLQQRQIGVDIYGRCMLRGCNLCDGYRKKLEADKWIPVEERLPERNQEVLCWVRSTTISGTETYILGSCDNGFWFLKTYEIDRASFPVKDYTILAWKPLPQPYKKEGAE